MGITVSQLHDEWRHSIIIVIASSIFIWDKQLSENHCIVGISSKLPWPPFSGVRRRRMNDELIRFPIKGGRRLQVRNIRAVTNLRLGVAPMYLIVSTFWQPIISLLLCGKFIKAHMEHSAVQPQQEFSLMWSKPEIFNVHLWHNAFRLQLLGNRKFPHPVLLHLIC